jgi:murein DD-endopeptidase MepM/ murein hydrolase activator NlpD
MPSTLKKYYVKFLLFLLAVLKGVGRILLFLLKSIGIPFVFLWRLFVRRLVFVVYRLLLRARLAASGVLPPVRRTFFAIFGHRYVVHAAVAIIAIFVSTSNLYAQGADLAQSNTQSLFYDLLNIPTGDYASPDSGDVNAESQLNDVLAGSATSSMQIAKSSVTDSEPLTYDQSGVVVPHAVPGTDTGILDQGEEKIVISKPTTYTIQEGDTVSGIAKKFGISVNTILWANDMTARSLLKLGHDLTILPVSGVQHSVKKGETLGAIAKMYGTDIDKILSANRVQAASQIRIGESLVIPDGKPPVTEVRRVAPSPPPRLGDIRDVFKPPPEDVAGQEAATGKLAWPTDQHLINQRYWSRHPGLDINGTKANHTYAADDGIVTFSGWNSGGYGNMVLIDHGNGMITRYGHHTKLYVSVGDHVTKGQLIGEVGSTGHSTGPHLHFEIYVNGKRVNPLSYYR